MRSAAFLIAGLLALPSVAAEFSERPDKVALTVYHSGNDYERGNPFEFSDPRAEDGLAFVSETRTIDIPAGPAVIEFRGVVSTIVPQTATMEGLPDEILERNFDYDLLGPGSLIEKSVGSTVTLVRTDKKTGKRSEQKGVLRSGPNGAVLDFGGTYEALKCSGLPEKLVFDRVPDGLRDTPTLSIRTNAAKAGRYTVKLHYLAAGMNWAANYVAKITPDGQHFDVTGWVTLINGSDTGFTGVPLDIVAGHLETDDDSKPVEAAKIFVQTGCWPIGTDWLKRSRAIEERLSGRASLSSALSVKAVSDDVMETVTVTGFRAALDLGDYKLYRLGRPADVLARQTKQIQFIDQQNVPFQRIYGAAIAETIGPQTAFVGIRFDNRKESQLGLPLPAGYFALTGGDPARPPVLLGRANFPDTANGTPVELRLGEALDVYVEERVVEHKKEKGFFTSSGTRITMDIVVQNNKTQAIPFELYSQLGDGTEIVSEPVQRVKRPYGMAWAFTVAAGETRTLRFVFKNPD